MNAIHLKLHKIVKDVWHEEWQRLVVLPFKKNSLNDQKL